jgi:hypothetical protein
MKCALCGKNIENYDTVLHRLKIDDTCSIDICQECIDKFVKWQGIKYAKLFPTKSMKKWHERNK